jgi:4-hydroxy-tetrahydrodipicolinate reductase
MGFNGKLGKLIKNELTTDDKFHFIEGIERDIKINELSNIIVDVSSDDGTKQLINYLIDNEINKPLLIGTTGLDDKVIQSLKIYSINNPVAIISNFSIGIKKIKKLIDEINKLNSDWKFSMIEKHHIHKKDSPSGTAKTLKSLLNRDCKIDSERENEIIGYHQIKIQTDNEEIVISHNAKDRNLFAKGCLEYISWLKNKKPGLYYEMDNDDKSDFLIKTSLGSKYIISEKKSVIEKLISDKKINNDITSLLLLNIDIKKKITNLTWTEYKINGEEIKSNCNSNEILSIVKYVFETNKITNGKINDKQLFKYDDTKFYIECNDTPITFDNCTTEFENLRLLLNQLSGLSVVGISKYKLSNFYLVIELAEDIENIDSDIFTTLGSIINGDKELHNAYNICFINIKDNNILKTRYFDKNVNKETDGNAYGCIVVFEYLAYVNELSYDEEIEGNIILKNDIIKVIYKENRYYIVFS